jgi:uncharacterized protein YgbK (DUF1537 family)
VEDTKTIVVLDDDPTGCQTVHDIPVLLDWSDHIIRDALSRYKCFFILHNSRSMPEAQAAAVNKEIVGTLLRHIDKEKLEIISRSDSTLRGHFLAETMTIEEQLGPYDGILLLPFFKEGNRVTLQDTHYIQSGEVLTPANETEFANDPVFGFTTAHMPSWVEEKSHGRWRKEDVLSVGLHHLRDGNLDAVVDILRQASNLRPVVVNAYEYADLQVLKDALVRSGKRFLHRSAASWVRVMATQTNHPLYRPARVLQPGLVLAGSYTGKTSAQLQRLQQSADLAHFELKIEDILSRYQSYLQQSSEQLNDALGRHQSTLVSTERTYQDLGDKSSRLERGQTISRFLVELVQRLTVQPGFIIAKGGITSYDIARHGLGIRQAMVMGQAQPGIPVWQALDQDQWANVPYVVFPGNVGDDDTLAAVFQAFIKST